MTARLSVRGLARPGLAPASFDLAAGERVAVIGPSGSGKSLLLRAIADLDPNEGEVSLDGVPRAAMPAPRWRRQVCYLAANAGWWAETVAAHFADAEAPRTFLERLDLPQEALEWPVARLSTGERQRLALARVLVNAPRVMLLDEPTAALDAAAAVRVEAVLDEARGQGAAMLVVTHDPAQARRLATRALRLEAGALSEEP